MYYIIIDNEYYSGSCYIFQGESYAATTNKQGSKIYKSKKIAQNTTERLLKKCVNVDKIYIKGD